MNSLYSAFRSRLFATTRMPYTPSPAGQKTPSQFADWYARTRDLPENIPLYLAVVTAVGAGLYTAKHVYFRTVAGSYLNVDVRGDPFAQAQVEGDHFNKTHRSDSLMHKLAQYRKDDQGEMIGIFGEHHGAAQDTPQRRAAEAVEKRTAFDLRAAP